MKTELVTTLPQALAVRKIRNECREFMTNYTGEISLLQQIYWFYTYYQNALTAKDYRVYLAKEAGKPIGYGALHLENQQLHVTEGVTTNLRGMGYGTKILNDMVLVAVEDNLPLVAVIRKDNQRSVLLHTKNGFVLDGRDGDNNIYHYEP